MRDIQFPIFQTKIPGVDKQFDLADVEQRKEYFELKVGPEIKKLRDYLEKNTFIAYLLGKKSSGKGTYAKMFQEIVSPNRISHFSIGDMIRSFDEVVKDNDKLTAFETELEKNYRGFVPLKEIISAMQARNTQVLLPSELIVALVKMEISKRQKTAIFIDGFPRNLDQISYSLFFRDLIGYRDDPDILVLIDVPENVIDERIKSRVICPLCQTSRGLRLLSTKKAGYDEEKKEFYLFCDNTNCQGAKMVPKEGDEFGIDSIRERLKTDEILIKQAFSLHGIPKILLRNSVPKDKVKDTVDEYELTPEFSYELKDGEVAIKEKFWQVQDDEGVVSYSLMPPPVVVSLIKQLVEVLGL